jgi:hypothetical protein
MVSDASFTQVRRSKFTCVADLRVIDIDSINFSLALATSLPVLAATLAFVTYTLTAHNFNVAIIFSSLSLFQVNYVQRHIQTCS